MNLKTRLRSAGMRYFSSPGYQEKLRAKARRVRSKTGQATVVRYFHQVDDPYSHLTVQKLDELKATYSLPFETHLVTKPDTAYQGSADHFDHWARRDAQSVARNYQTSFTPTINTPGSQAIALANQALATHLNHDDFAQTAIEVGTALWSGGSIATAGDPQESLAKITEGNELRETLGHYQGGMFYFDGEWYWGIDRIRLLEARLIEEGFHTRQHSNSTTLCVPEPCPQGTSGLDTKHILLEYFPSLRSPYTAIGHQRVLDLIHRSGVRFEVRPVMPMLMRGIPAPRAKQRYIITDAAREARGRGVPFGRIVDPFGEPVKRAFALFPGAAKLGKGLEFITAYLQATWFEGLDITTQRGLRCVVENAAIDWHTLQEATQNTDWQALLEDNLNAMLGVNLWGVPSFRVSGGNVASIPNGDDFVCWGQDRIWRVEDEIAARI